MVKVFCVQVRWRRGRRQNNGTSPISQEVSVCVWVHACYWSKGNIVSPSLRKASCEKVVPPSLMSNECQRWWTVYTFLPGQRLLLPQCLCNAHSWLTAPKNKKHSSQRLDTWVHHSRCTVRSSHTPLVVHTSQGFCLSHQKKLGTESTILGAL